jgi:pilus assembly protein Flp/PilA
MGSLVLANYLLILAPKIEMYPLTDLFTRAKLIPSGQRLWLARRLQITPGGTPMKHLLLKLRVLKDTSGQDLIEYALMAGFVAVAAGAIMPGVSVSISQIFSKVASVLSSANSN